MQYYNIIKFRQNGTSNILNGYGRLTLEKAREICNDPETSSMTAKKACHGDEKLIIKWHEKQKHWFLGFTKV